MSSEKITPTTSSSPKPLSPPTSPAPLSKLPKPTGGGWPLVFYYLGDSMYRLYLKVKEENPMVDAFLSGIFGTGVAVGVKSIWDYGFGTKRKNKEEEDDRHREVLALVKSVKVELGTDLNAGLVQTNAEIKMLKCEMNLKFKNVEKKFENVQQQLQQQQSQQQQFQLQLQKLQLQQTSRNVPVDFSQSGFFPNLSRLQQIRLGTMVLNGLSKIFRK